MRNSSSAVRKDSEFELENYRHYEKPYEISELPHSQTSARGNRSHWYFQIILFFIALVAAACAQLFDAANSPKNSSSARDQAVTSAKLLQEAQMIIQQAQALDRSLAADGLKPTGPSK